MGSWLRRTRWRLAHLLLAGVLLGACAARPPRTGPAADLRLDTETSGRLRHASLRGATGSGSAPQTVASSLARFAPLLLGVLKSNKAASELELRLLECARGAERQVNAHLFGNRPPSREECSERVGVDACGRPITRAMELGRRKHAVALRCANEVLKQLWPAPFSIEQRYRYHPHARVLETVSPAEEKRLIEEDCTGELWRTIKPDLVLHADFNLLRAVLIVDFKFPCPDSNFPRWTDYGKGSAYNGFSQDTIYSDALGGAPVLLSPRGFY